jgi:hypothetical protein
MYTEVCHTYDVRRQPTNKKERDKKKKQEREEEERGR